MKNDNVLRIALAFALAPLAGLVGCGSGGSGGSGDPGGSAPDSETFVYSTMESRELALTVAEGGDPVRGARVQVVGVLPRPAFDQTIEDVTTGEVFFRGVTDADGSARATLRFPSTVRSVDVIVDAEGLEGPYTVPEFRAEWGPFAPSSRTTRSIDVLEDLAVELYR